MTKKNETAAAVEVKAKVVQSKVEQEFYIYELQEHSRKLFGVRPEVFNGALLYYKQNKITKKEAQRLIERFLKKEAK